MPSREERVHILVLGHDAFAGPLRRLGHRVTVCGRDPSAEVKVRDPDPDWRSLAGTAEARGVEAVLVTDDIGSRKLPCGLWKADMPTAFYGLDSPLNRFWQEPYARLFDLAWLDQPDEAARLAAGHPACSWLPVGIDPALYQGSGQGPRQAGVCFVGVRNDAVRPKRDAVLKRVAAAAPLLAAGQRGAGWVSPQEAAALYRAHDVSLNENLFPGVTTRPLEIMAAGGCLLTEAAAGAMDRFFQHYEHCAYYDSSSLEHVLEELLRDQGLRGRLAANGREAVLAGHTLDNRARVMAEALEGLAASGRAGEGRPSPGDCLMYEGQALTMAGLRWPAKGGMRRLNRGGLRLRAAATDGAEPVKASYYAGLSLFAAGDAREGLGFLRQAAERGGGLEALAWALAAHQGGDGASAEQALAGLARTRPEFKGKGDQLHLAAADLLIAGGVGMRAGFNGKDLPMALWSAFEHLHYVCANQPGNSEAWEKAGDLLMGHGAAWEAHHCYQKAYGIDNLPAIKTKMDEAAEKGYLSHEP